MRVRQIEEAAAVAAMPQFHGNFCLLQRLQNFAEARELKIGKGLVRFIRLREMRHYAFEPQGFFRDNLLDDRQRLVPARAIAAHAGVDFNMHRHRFAEARPEGGERADGVRFVHTNCQIVRHAPFQFGLLPFAEQQQRRGDAAVAQVHRLFERAQAKTPRAFFQRDARHIQRAVAVSLVFHDGEQFYVRAASRGE